VHFEGTVTLQVRVCERSARTNFPTSGVPVNDERLMKDNDPGKYFYGDVMIDMPINH
jgi:hypothetical protein